MSGEVGIGIVGYGIMGKAHSYGYTVAPVMRRLRHRPRLRVISGRDKQKVDAAAVAYGVDGSVIDWRDLVRRPEVDIVDICTPPGTHAEIAIAAAAAGKAVICEKPLAVTYPQAASAVDAAGKARVLNAVGFNYRSLPAVSLMKRMIGEGAVGKIRLLRATWLSDEFVDPTIPFDWRFDRSMGGTTIADLGSHLIDLATWMAGPIAEVSGQSETFIRQRSDKAVTVDEASAALVRFESGARGVLEMARVAVRRPCDFTIEVNGDRGTLVFEYARLNELLHGDGGTDRSCTACGGSAPSSRVIPTPPTGGRSGRVWATDRASSTTWATCSIGGRTARGIRTSRRAPRCRRCATRSSAPRRRADGLTSGRLSVKPYPTWRLCRRPPQPVGR